MIKALSPDQFKEKLFAIMDRKDHWAWPLLFGPQCTKAQIETHYRQEYAVYVRDFPVLLARVHGKNPPQDIRQALAENIYEEDTGKLSVGRSHPELFLEMMEGLGFKRNEFDNVTLLPASVAYRRWIDQMTSAEDWLVGTAVMTIFVEGSINDRVEIGRPPEIKTPEQIEAVVDRHHLVRHHGIARDRMDLIRAHQQVEAGHRQAAYGMVLAHARTKDQQERVLEVLGSALESWLRYRDGVAAASGLKKPS